MHTQPGQGAAARAASGGPASFGWMPASPGISGWLLVLMALLAWLSPSGPFTSGGEALAQTVEELARRPLSSALPRQPDARAEPPRIPVAATTIYPGEVITAAMLRLRPVSRRFAMRGGFIAEPAAIIGKMARRTLPRGRPVPPNALREPYVVRSGKAVRIVFRSGALRISALGVALASASAGEPVAVRNVDSGRIVHGVAMKDGTVQVGNTGLR